MLQYEKISISEEIDIDNTSASKECLIIIGTLKMLDACNKCHDVFITAYELKNISILNVKEVDFRCILWGISWDEAVNMLNNSVLEDNGVL